MKIRIVRTSLWNDDKPCNDERLKKETHLSDNGEKYTSWFIDNQCTEVVIGKSWNNINDWELEIYDTYRE